jgi:DNA-binding Xre family transcriptional regulator
MERKNVGEIRDAYNELLEKVVLALTDRNLAKVARNIRIHENTLRTIANGKNKRPAFETLEILADYLFEDTQ